MEYITIFYKMLKLVIARFSENYRIKNKIFKLGQLDEKKGEIKLKGLYFYKN
jgi:hypothetical protein